MKEEEERQQAQLQTNSEYSASTTSPAICARHDMARDLIGCMVDSPTSAVFGDTIDEDFCAIYESENAKALLEEDPVDIYNLEKNVSTKGIPSQNVEKEYDKICADIKSHSDQIVHVFPAYKMKMKTQIVFVVIAKRKISLDLPWKLEVRLLNQYAAESKSSTYCKDNSPLPTAISRTIGNIIDKNAPQLMQNHSYLSAISASSVISKGYGTSNHRIVAKPCIVLSVLVKHFIPVNEKPFPTMIDGFPVDVRECAVVFCGSSAEDFHDRVKMGCKISSGFLPQKHGTLGGFVEHPEYGLCGITCAHVVLDDKLKFELKEKVNVKENEMDPCKLFQPSFDLQNQNVIGKLVEVIYKEGGKGTAGVDLALFKLEQRLPTEGNFPNYQGAETSIRYESGNVWGKSGIPSNESEVQKFGFVTGLTYGRIQFNNAAVREFSFHSDMKVDTKKFTTTLYKQYHIKSNDERHEFSKLGDSGALVFIKDLGEENDLRCIGMVVGVLTDDTCAITPITAILEALHVTQLKPFLPNITWEKIDRRLREMEDRLL